MSINSAFKNSCHCEPPPFGGVAIPYLDCFIRLFPQSATLPVIPNECEESRFV